MYIYIYTYIYTHIYTYIVHMGMKWLIPQNGWCMDGFQSQRWLVGLWCLLVPRNVAVRKSWAQTHRPIVPIDSWATPYGPTALSGSQCCVPTGWFSPATTDNDGRTTDSSHLVRRQLRSVVCRRNSPRLFAEPERKWGKLRFQRIVNGFSYYTAMMMLGAKSSFRHHMAINWIGIELGIIAANPPFLGTSITVSFRQSAYWQLRKLRKLESESFWVPWHSISMHQLSFVWNILTWWVTFSSNMLEYPY